jgi:hypothetical protein
MRRVFSHVSYAAAAASISKRTRPASLSSSSPRMLSSSLRQPLSSFASNKPSQGCFYNAFAQHEEKITPWQNKSIQQHRRWKFRRGAATAVFAEGMGLSLKENDSALDLSSGTDIKQLVGPYQHHHRHQQETAGATMASKELIAALVNPLAVSTGSLKSPIASPPSLPSTANDSKTDVGRISGDTLLPQLQCELQAQSQPSLLHKEIAAFAGRCCDAANVRRQAYNNILGRLNRAVRSLWSDGRVAPCKSSFC